MKYRLIILVSAAVFSLMSLFLNPFQFDLGNSGRYLLPVLKTMDPDLFPGDAEVESLRRFGSVFYVALSGALTTAHIQPDHIEVVMVGLFVFSRFLFALALLYLAWELSDCDTERWILASILLVWFSFPAAVSMAGVAIAQPTMNHSTVSEALMAVSLVLLVSRRYGSMVVINAADVWVHPLMAVHRMVGLTPAMFVGAGFRKAVTGIVLLLVIFAFSLATYGALLAPPGLTGQEEEILIAAKGRMDHTSPFVQSWKAWVEFISLIVLAWCATRRLTAMTADRRIRALWVTIVAGGFAAITLAGVNHFAQIPALIRLQPMRMLMLPWFCLVVLVGIGTTRAFVQKDPTGPWLAAAVATSMVHGGIGVLVAPIAALFVLALASDHDGNQQWLRSKVTFSAFGVVVVLAALVLHRSPHFFVGALAVAGISGVLSANQPPGKMVATLLGVFLAAGAVSSHVFYRVEPAISTGRPRVDSDYHQVLDWIRANTPKNARFVTEPGLAFFPARSLRTSVNEGIPAIVWVDPRQSEDARITSRQFDRFFEEPMSPSDHEDLVKIAAELGIDYVLTRNENFLPSRPEYSNGPFSVFKIQ